MPDVPAWLVVLGAAVGYAIKALTELAERPDVTEDDRRLIKAALTVTLAPLETTWDDVHQRGGTVEVVDLGPGRSEREEQEP